MAVYSMAPGYLVDLCRAVDAISADLSPASTALQIVVSCRFCASECQLTEDMFLDSPIHLWMN